MGVTKLEYLREKIANLEVAEDFDTREQVEDIRLAFNALVSRLDELVVELIRHNAD